MGTTRVCLLALALGLCAATPALAQTPTPGASEPPPPPPLDPAPAPPVDAVSGDTTPPEEPPPEPPPLPEPEPPPEPEPEAPPPPAPAPAPVVPDVAVDEPAAHSRAGFFFSAGFGYSVTRWLLDLEINDSNASIASLTDLGFASLLKVGYGIGEQTAVHFTHRATWLDMFDPAALDPQRRMLHLGAVHGIGVTHFFHPEERSAYIGADVGVAHWLEIDLEEIVRDWSNVHVGACAAVGYQFSGFMSFEHSLCWSPVESARRDVEVATEADAIFGAPLWASFTLNYL